VAAGPGVDGVLADAEEVSRVPAMVRDASGSRSLPESYVPARRATRIDPALSGAAFGIGAVNRIPRTGPHGSEVDRQAYRERGGRRWWRPRRYRPPIFLNLGPQLPR